jgi:hypothetical protein
VARAVARRGRRARRLEGAVARGGEEHVIIVALALVIIIALVIIARVAGGRGGQVDIVKVIAARVLEVIVRDAAVQVVVVAVLKGVGVGLGGRGCGGAWGCGAAGGEVFQSTNGGAGEYASICQSTDVGGDRQVPFIQPKLSPRSS